MQLEFTQKEKEALISLLKDETTAIEMVGEPMFDEEFQTNKSILKKLGFDYVEGQVDLKKDRTKDSCYKCGITFNEALYARMGMIFNPENDENDQWICGKCDSPEIFEQKKQAQKLVRATVSVKCPKCSKKMKALVSFQCICGEER